MLHLVRGAGEYQVLDRASGREVEAGQTLLCAHCQAMWEVQPGSGRRRGWCYRCADHLCGRPECLATCAPWERQVESMERRQRLRDAVARNFGV